MAREKTRRCDYCERDLPPSAWTRPRNSANPCDNPCDECHALCPESVPTVDRYTCERCLATLDASRFAIAGGKHSLCMSCHELAESRRPGRDEWLATREQREAEQHAANDAAANTDALIARLLGDAREATGGLAGGFTVVSGLADDDPANAAMVELRDIHEATQALNERAAGLARRRKQALAELNVEARRIAKARKAISERLWQVASRAAGCEAEPQLWLPL